MTTGNDFSNGMTILRHLMPQSVEFNPTAAIALTHSADRRVSEGARLLARRASSHVGDSLPTLAPRYTTDSETGKRMLLTSLRWVERGFAGPDRTTMRDLFGLGREIRTYDCGVLVWDILARATGHDAQYGPDLWATCADVATALTGENVSRNTAKQQMMRLIAHSHTPAPAPWAAKVLDQVARPWLRYLEMTATTPWVLPTLGNRMVLENLAKTARTWNNTATALMWIGCDTMVVAED